MSVFENVKKNFGFGCMRLPMENDEVNIPEMTKMVDTFLDNGFNYFDTASGYLGGKSEKALKVCLTSRYPRESYILTNKLSNHLFKSEEEIRPAFQKQLEACGVEYFVILNGSRFVAFPSAIRPHFDSHVIVIYDEFFQA